VLNIPSENADTSNEKEVTDLYLPQKGREIGPNTSPCFDINTLFYYIKKIHPLALSLWNYIVKLNRSLN